MTSATTLEDYFNFFRKNTIGNDLVFDSSYGKKDLEYADLTGSGRAYQPIEETLQTEVMPFWANSHTKTTVTGSYITHAYERAKSIIKCHVNSGDDDVLIFCGSGMTSAVNKLQRLLGLRISERLADYLVLESQINIDENLRPVVFITEMEHHSNHTSWLQTIAEVEIIRSGPNGNVDLEYFKSLLKKYQHRKNKIAAVTACSNVTGIETPLTEIAKMIHQSGGLCFVDFACSAPYATIDMHPKESGAHLDAIYFSAHKFLGGPGTPGVLVFNQRLYTNKIPDQPGGGTILYSNPWQECHYISDIEMREDGGTPPLLQAIKAAMCIRLKEAMGVDNIRKREEELVKILFERFAKIKKVRVLEGHIKKRLGIFSFIVIGAHYNLIVRLLNDRFGIQARGGCSCASTYGHRLLQVDKRSSFKILESLQKGDLSCKPGWIRISIHPIMTDAAINWVMDAIELTVANFEKWAKDYIYNNLTNEFNFTGFTLNKKQLEIDCFDSFSPST